MSGLPKGWAEIEIGQLMRVVSGGTPPSKDESNFSSEGGIPWLTPADLSGYRAKYIARGARNLSEKGYAACSATKMPAGSVLFSSRAPVGYVAVAANEMSTNQGFKSFIPPDGFSSVFLYYYLKHIKPVAEQLATGTTFKELSGAAAAKLPLLVAPLPEQKRIADKLDSVLARVDVCRDRLDRIPALLKRFRQSVLAAATSGRLTEDWRGSGAVGDAFRELKDWLALRAREEKKAPAEPDLTNWATALPAGWVVCSVHQFAECLDRLRVPIKRELRKSSAGLYPYYGANGEVGRIDEYIFDDELVLVTEDETFYGREKPIAYRVSGKCWVNNHAHVLRAQTKTGNDYLCFALMHYNVIPWLSGTTGRAKLTQQALNSLPVACPPKAEMEEIVRRVETLFAFAGRLEARCAAARKQAGQLTPALLAKAFRGELVPQDPADEPAAELLKRLATSRADAPKARRGKPRASTGV